MLGRSLDYPGWYDIDRAARRYGISPLQAEELPIKWIEAARVAEWAEEAAMIEKYGVPNK